MRIQIRILESGKTYEGEIDLMKVGSVGEVEEKRGANIAEVARTKPSEAIDGLYRTGFFSRERTLADALAQLGKDGYNFSPPSILMALKARGFLQRRGNKGSYRFVQKFPPPSYSIVKVGS